MASRLPSGINELLKVDTSNLKITLEYLAEWSHQNSEDLNTTNLQLDQTATSLRMELSRLPTLESDVKSCLEGLGEVQRISVRQT